MNDIVKKRFFTKKKILVSIIVVFILAASVVGVSAANRHKKFRDDGPFGFMIDRVTKELNLTAQQKTQVDVLKKELKDKMEAERVKRDDGSEDMMSLFRKDVITKEELTQVFAKREQRKAEMQEFAIDQIIKFHSILTPDQRNKAADKMNEYKSKRDKWHDGHKDKFPENR